MADLRSTAEDVQALSKEARRSRLDALVSESHSILERSIEEHVLADGRYLSGIVGLYSGGNDSTVLMHLFRRVVCFAGHANTGVGIEKTRQFVRDTCAQWDIPLLERRAPRPQDHYRALVLDQGFPGPGMHYKMYQRLKERALEQIRREVVTRPYRERVVFLAGRRRDESSRRAKVPENERRGSTVWVSPMVNWTKPDMSLYRRTYGPVPLNEVTALIHMSGECLCGAFAHKGEREETSMWFPDAFEEIAELERLLAPREDIPEQRKRWGWGSEGDKPPSEPAETGMLCTSCDERWETAR